MRQIRIYKDIEFAWRVTANGQPVSLEDATLQVYVVRPDNTRADLTPTLAVSGDRLTFRYPHELHTRLGVHRLELWANLGTPSQTITDIPGAFRLVALSTMEGGDDAADLGVEHVTLQTSGFSTAHVQTDTGGGRHFLMATTLGGELKLQGNLEAILAEGLVPVLFRKVRRTAMSASANNGEGSTKRKAGWARVGAGNLLEVGPDGAVRISVRVLGESSNLWYTTGEYTSSAEAYAMKNKESQRIMWGRNSKEDVEGCTLRYAVGFVSSDYPFEDKKAPFDWTKIKTDLAKFKVSKKKVKGNLAWVFCIY